MNATAHDGGRDLAAEFDLVTARAGLPVPAEWRAGAVASYAELMAFADLLRSPGRPAGSEPAAVYRIEECDAEAPGADGDRAGGAGAPDRTGVDDGTPVPDGTGVEGGRR
ncbi:hypothetical protein [Streptomyces glaucus]|uniref:Uncharacterized protein n=1 Tax=Streptomyces glaucus TaxID=284029 RepID=A0ABN3J4Z3_9ACTN